MRERLIELLNVAVGDSNLTDGEVKIVADYLLANGVIVPPCKVGDKVYVADNGGIREATTAEMYFHGSDDIVIILSFDCDYDCETCPFSSWSQDPCGEYSCGGEYGCWEARIEDFSKTVFLTREEAEEAMNRRAEQ